MRVTSAFSLLFISIFTRLTAGASTRQSPIDLFGFIAGSFSPFTFRGFDTPAQHVQLVNDGYSLTVMLPPVYEVSGGGLAETYIPLQFHMHWDTNGAGSEHARFGEKYAAELHVVMRRQSMSTSEAVRSGKRNSLAVLGFFLRQTVHENRFWKNFISAIPRVQIYERRNHTRIPGDFVLNDIIYNGEKKYGDFFRYSGSLTTPPYNEIVEWTVFSQPIDVSKSQLDVIRSIMIKGHRIVSNYREVQSVDGRFVQASGTKLLEEQDRRIARPLSSSGSSEFSPVRAGDNMIPGTTVAIIFTIMAVVCAVCMGGVIYLAYAIRSAKGY